MGSQEINVPMFGFVVFSMSGNSFETIFLGRTHVEIETRSKAESSFFSDLQADGRGQAANQNIESCVGALVLIGLHTVI